MSLLPVPVDEMAHTVVLVTGSRTITSSRIVADFMERRIAALPVPMSTIELLHGGAAGVDTLAGAWATAHGIPVRIERPDFVTFPRARFGNKAYAMRDLNMVYQADHVLALWDGKSPGTKLTADAARRLHKPLVQEIPTPPY